MSRSLGLTPSPVQRGIFAIGIACWMSTLPTTITDTLALLGSADYIADRSLATAVHLALHLKRPLFLEGEAGVGKTEIAKVLARSEERRVGKECRYRWGPSQEKKKIMIYSKS